MVVNHVHRTYYRYILLVLFAMSRGKITATETTFPAALRQFREQVLGVRTQVEMAAQLGVSVYVYNNWEKGRSEPSIQEFVRILNLCPSEECRSAFGLEGLLAGVEKQDGSMRQKIQTVNVEAQMGKGPMSDPELREWHKNIQEVVRYLGNQKRAGNKVAAEMLRSMAQSVVRAAGLATEPGMSSARRAKLIKEEIKRLEKII